MGRRWPGSSGWSSGKKVKLIIKVEIREAKV